MQPDSATKETPQLGAEYPQPNEVMIAEKIIKLLKDEMLRTYPPSPNGKRQLRQIHPKMNGCVKAEFIIEKGLAPELRVGLFKEERSFPAWIRFSNGKTHPIPDYKKDIRGFAIKIMNVPGKKLDITDPDITSHDFILMNTKNFVSGNVKKFADILSVVTTPLTLTSLPRKIGIAFSNLDVLKRAGKAAVKIDHPCELSYFSTTPFRFGGETKAVKYAVVPSPSNKLLTPDKTSEDLLRVNFGATVKENSLEYDFMVQFQTDAVKMPVEDPTVVWDSPLIKLATIRIPTQICDTPERNEMGDNLSFNSWHCLPEHQPLGSFNRVRKFIYEEMYAFRHNHNGIVDKEPTAGPDFFNDTNKS
jgi:hypothetical protein